MAGRKIKRLAPVHPGQVLQEVLSEAELTVNALAMSLRVPANRIGAIIKGQRGITADTALRLGKYFGVSPEIWLNLQTDYDLRVARRTSWPGVESRVRIRAA